MSQKNVFEPKIGKRDFLGFFLSSCAGKYIFLLCTVAKFTYFKERERERADTDASLTENKGIECGGQWTIPVNDWEKEEKTFPDHEISKMGWKAWLCD